MNSVVERIRQGTGCEEDAEHRKIALGLMVEGARAFAEWCLRQADDKIADGVDSALEEFAEDLYGSEAEPLERVVSLPPGWAAIPGQMTGEMLEAFQRGFTRELKKRKGRTLTAEQAGLLEALKAVPCVPDGWRIK